MPIERQVIEPEQVETPDKSENKTSGPRAFFHEKVDQEGNFKDIGIDYFLLIEHLKYLGYRRFDLLEERTNIYIMVEDKLIREVIKEQIIDGFEDYIYDQVDFSHCHKVNPERLLDKLYRGSYFKDSLLNRMKIDEPLEVCKDSLKAAYFYFNNTAVKVTADGWEPVSYAELDGYIWKNQMLDRDFEKLELEGKEDAGVFADFCRKISQEHRQPQNEREQQENEERFLSLCSIIGYNLHSFTDYKMRATIFTDSRISEDAEGRSGKTLLCKALGQVRSYCEINGKDFDPKDKHKFQAADLDTQIVHLNDVKRNFFFQDLYNDITEGIKVEKKGKTPFQLPVKMILSTNQTIKLDGGSSKDRAIEFELSDYFSSKHTPEDEYGQWFFRDWKQPEWSKFYNFLMYCVAVFLIHQKPIIPRSINLERRKLLDHTAPEFVAYMEELLEDFRKGEGTEFEVAKQDQFKEFTGKYPDFTTGRYQLKQRTFTGWLRAFSNYSSWLQPNDPNKHERRGNAGTDYITFEKKEL